MEAERQTKDSDSLDRCIQTALAALYPPFQATSPTVLCQVLNVVESCYRGDSLRYLIHFLLPAKTLLQNLQQDACVQYCDLVFHHEGWPLCVHEKVIVQLCPLDQRLLCPGDFYLLVSPAAAPRAHSASCRSSVSFAPRLLLCSVSAGDHHVEQQEVSEVALRSLFSMAWLDSVNREREQRGASRLERCLLSAHGDVFRVPWEDLVYPQFISRPRTVPKEDQESSVKDGHAQIDAPHEDRMNTNSSQDKKLLPPSEKINQSPASSEGEESEGEYVELTELPLPRFSPQKGSLTQSISLQHRARTSTHTHTAHTHTAAAAHTLSAHTHSSGVEDSSPTGLCSRLIEENFKQDCGGPVVLTPVSSSSSSSSSSSAPPEVVGTSRTEGPTEPEPPAAVPAVPVQLSRSSQSRFYRLLLRSGAVCLPGTRDRSGRALLTVCTSGTVWSNLDCDGAALHRLMLYYASTLRKEVRALGLTVLVDARRDSPALPLCSALRWLQEDSPRSVHTVLILVNKDSGSLRVDKPAATKVEVLSSLKSVQKHVELQQLPAEYGGSFIFSQSSWISFRSRVEQLTNQCEDVIQLLQKTIDTLQTTPLPDAAQDAQLLLSRYKALMGSVLEDRRLVQLQQEGGASLSRLRREEGGMTEEQRAAVEAVAFLYEQVDELLHRLVTLSNSRTQNLDFIVDFRSLETGFSQVSSWLEEVGEVRLKTLDEPEDSLELLNRKQTDFKEFYTTAYDQCKRGEALLARLQSWDNVSSADLHVYEVKVQSFWAQLQDFSQRVNSTGQNIERAVRLFCFLDQPEAAAEEDPQLRLPPTPEVSRCGPCPRALSEPARHGNTGVFIRGLEVSSAEAANRTLCPRTAAHGWAGQGPRSPATPGSSRTPGSPAADPRPRGSKLRHIVEEMVTTEREYVRSLRYTLHHYSPEMDRADLPQDLRGKRSVVFGNLEKLLDFHSQFFLRELEACWKHPLRVPHCFLRHQEQFGLYALYSKNKPKSDALLAHHGHSFFRRKQLELGDKMDLSSYLLKPVQRMSKYALLLTDLMKEVGVAQEAELVALQAATNMVKFQLRHGNDLLAMDAIRDCDVNLKEQGQLIRQDEFTVWTGRRKCQRHIFLFEELVLFSKPKKMEGGLDVFIYKHSFKTADVGLTESTGDSGLRFEIWFRRRTSKNQTFVLQAATADVKLAWTSEVAGILWTQASRNKETRLKEMVSMGVGNKPFLDIQPSDAAISDRAVHYIMKSRGARTRASIAVSVFDHSNPFKRGAVTSDPAASGPSSSSLLGPLNLHMYSQNRPSSPDADASFSAACIEEDEQETSSQPSMTTESSGSSSRCLSGSTGSDSGCVSSHLQEALPEEAGPLSQPSSSSSSSSSNKRRLNSRFDSAKAASVIGPATIV
ncbi:puratrophin-1 [Brachyistius frenatus]|uniref:puratrophin-1 n=1 Tax=Brachyistius frenatus TaxID=100188 RepID=UPI0037E7B2CB